MGSSGAGKIAWCPARRADRGGRSPEFIRRLNVSSTGKTMLLNILAGRLSAAGNGRTSGQILLNGKKRHIGKPRANDAPAPETP